MIELDNWLEYNELNRGHSRTTVGNYRLIVRSFGDWLATQNLSPEQAQPEHLQRFAGAVLHERRLSPSSRRVAVSALRGYYRWLLQRRLIRSDPSTTLPYPRVGRGLPLPIPAAAAEKLMAQPDLDSFKGVRDLAIMAVLLGCGPRVSGVTGLNEGNLIFAHNEDGFEELTLLLREKGANERLVPAPDETRLLLRAYLGHPDLEQIDRRLPSGDRVLFVNIYNSHVPEHEHRGEARRLTPLSVWKMLREYGAAAGIDPKTLHPHAFRHLYGQELAEGDVDLLVRQKLMGHSDPKSTELYSHIAHRKMRKAAIENNPMRRIKSPASGLAGLLRGK